MDYEIVDISEKVLKNCYYFNVSDLYFVVRERDRERERNIFAVIKGREG